MRFRYWQHYKTQFTCLGVALCLAALPIRACIDPAPETELEKIYCQIVAKGKGDDLPDYPAFRRNPPTTQALLLKRPAKKLGIDLPNPSNKPARLASKPVIQSQEQTVEVKSPSARPKTIEKKAIATTASLASCKLEQDIILCGATQHELQTNLSNKYLPAGALTAQNKLLLPSRQNTSFSGASDHYYLSQTYVTYIEKMIDLGLADATMSFTKYAATYDDIAQNNGDFALRFAQMYELLKKEKQTNAVKSRYNNNFPESLSQCMALSRNIIVCDNVMQNWIYRSR